MTNLQAQISDPPTQTELETLALLEKYAGDGEMRCHRELLFSALRRDPLAEPEADKFLSFKALDRLTYAAHRLEDRQWPDVVRAFGAMPHPFRFDLAEAFLWAALYDHGSPNSLRVAKVVL